MWRCNQRGCNRVGVEKEYTHQWQRLSRFNWLSDIAGDRVVHGGCEVAAFQSDRHSNSGAMKVLVSPDEPHLHFMESPHLGIVIFTQKKSLKTVPPSNNHAMAAKCNVPCSRA